MQSVCVYCGSSTGADAGFASAAGTLGELLATSGRTLVYGGGKVGLMGVLADAALRAGGRVVGVIPQALMDKEIAHTGLSELRVVGSMHERKALMADMASGFIALPGGLGTLEELFEAWTWAQLGLHAKPFGLLNVGRFFDPLLVFLDRLVEQHFVRPAHRAMLVVGDDAGSLIAAMAAQRPAYEPKWIDNGES